ncbi:hypothetical protein [Streptomyces sp. BPTC-684]|uniref:hypothetical protein n=1 Tax=Streptomyces sp. BPTC-684 TaxID=3043734 RepID=UPI0024B0E506|nr:hypothetical protein [Streptomyces sp. BPTC-684]WHM41049.1 hypothetical protein QIY60_32075 [Streptomyces sp. BPTC-684]
MRTVSKSSIRVPLIGALVTAALLGGIPPVLAAPAPAAERGPGAAGVVRAAAAASSVGKRGVRAYERVQVKMPTGQQAAGYRIPIPGSDVRSGIIVLTDRYTAYDGGHVLPTGSSGAEAEEAEAFVREMAEFVEELASAPQGRRLLEGISRMRPLDVAAGEAEAAAGLKDASAVFTRGMPDDPERWPEGLKKKYDAYKAADREAKVPDGELGMAAIMHMDVSATEPRAEPYNPAHTRDGIGTQGIVNVPDKRAAFLGYEANKKRILVGWVQMLAHELVHVAHYLQGALYPDTKIPVPVDYPAADGSVKTAEVQISGEEVATNGGKDAETLLPYVKARRDEPTLGMKHFEASADKAKEKLKEKAAGKEMDLEPLLQTQAARIDTFPLTETSLARERGWQAREHYSLPTAPLAKESGIPEEQLKGKFVTLPPGEKVTDADLKDPDAFEARLEKAGKKPLSRVVRACSRFFGRQPVVCHADGRPEEVTQETRSRIEEVRGVLREHPDAPLRLPVAEADPAAGGITREVVREKLEGFHGVKPGDVDSVLAGIERQGSAGNDDANWKAFYLAESESHAAGYSVAQEGMRMSAGGVVKVTVEGPLTVATVNIAKEQGETDGQFAERRLKRVKDELGVPGDAPLMDSLAEKKTVLKMKDGTTDRNGAERYELIVPWEMVQGNKPELVERFKKGTRGFADAEAMMHGCPVGPARLKRSAGAARAKGSVSGCTEIGFVQQLAEALDALRREGKTAAAAQALAEAAGALENAADAPAQIREKAKAVREKLEAAVAGGKADSTKLAEASAALTELAAALGEVGKPGTALAEVLAKQAKLPKVVPLEPRSYEEWKKTAQQMVDRARKGQTEVGGEVFTSSLRDSLTSERAFNVFPETAKHLNSALGAAMTPQMVIDAVKTLDSDADGLTKAAALTAFTPVLGPAVGLVDGLAHGNTEEAALSGAMLAGWLASQYVPAIGEIVDAGAALYVFGKAVVDEIGKAIADSQKMHHWAGGGLGAGATSFVDPEVVKKELGSRRDAAFHQMLTSVAQEKIRPQVEIAVKAMYGRLEQNVYASVAQIEATFQSRAGEPGMAQAIADTLPKIKDRAARLLADSAGQFEASMAKVMEANVRKLEGDTSLVADFNRKFMDAVRDEFGTCDNSTVGFGIDCMAQKQWARAFTIIKELPVQPIQETDFQRWFGTVPPSVADQSLRVGLRNSSGQDLELMKTEVEGTGRLVAPLPERLPKDKDQWLTLAHSTLSGKGPLRGSVTYGTGGTQKFTLRWETTDDGQHRYQVTQDAALSTQLVGGNTRERVAADNSQWHQLTAQRTAQDVVFADIAPQDKTIPSNSCATSSRGWPYEMYACVSFVNNTGQTVSISNAQAESGYFDSYPPQQVRPFEAVEWKTVSRSGLYGTEGRARILVGDTSTTIGWVNPRPGWLNHDAYVGDGEHRTRNADVGGRYHATAALNNDGNGADMTAAFTLTSK